MMTVNKILLTLILAVTGAAVLVAGCSSPTATPSATPTPTVPPEISAAPTQAPVNVTVANVLLQYKLHTAATTFDNLLPASPGCLYYAVDIQASSDRPADTNGAKFAFEYKANSSDSLKFYNVTVMDFPFGTIGNGAAPIQGRLLAMLPQAGSGSVGPIPVMYFKSPDQQSSPYKVTAPVYGTAGSW